MKRWIGDPYALCVVAVFLLSRAILRILLGMVFDTSSLIWAWQLLDPVWLKDDLFRSLWYLHMQPPLFNLLTAVALRLPFPDLFLDTLFLTLGLATSLVLYRLGLALGLNRLFSAVLVVVAFVLNPSSILYETWYFYTYPVLFLTSLFSLLLIRTSRRISLAGLLGALSVLTLLTLIRASYHIVLFLIVALPLVWYHVGRWRTVLAATLIAGSPALAWYMKNYALFGTFSATSWTGMNLFRMLWNMRGWDESRFRRLKEEGLVSPLMTVRPFAPPDVYISILGYDRRTGVPSLDSTVKPTVGTYNYNHSVYPTVSRILLRDNLRLFLRYPWAYARSVLSAFKIFTYPPYAYVYGPLHLLFYEGNMRTFKSLKVWIRTYDLLYGWLGKGFPGLTVLLLLLSFIYTLPRLLKFPGTGTLSLFLIYLIVVHTTFERRENMRFRFQFEPVLVVLVVASLLKRRSKTAPPPSS